MGWYISFSGPITYKNAVKVREAASVVPKDRVLVETDAPYLPPVPHRGKLNYSGYLHFTAEALANAMGLSLEEVSVCTVENTCRLFGITL
jgi:TatD DNase family protein